jgi:hypothetical protein
VLPIQDILMYASCLANTLIAKELLPAHRTTYRLANLRIISELTIPGLAPCCEKIPTGDKVVIRRGHVSRSLSSFSQVFPEGQCNRNELLLDIPGVARFLLRNGHEIVVDQAPASSHGDVCAYLLATAFGVLFHQRGTTPLHASAIDTEDGCTAFMGESGAGKSTLVAALAARGHQIIADDVCFLRLDDRGDVQAWPGVNRIRLWKDAMIALGCDWRGLEQVWRGWDKYFIPMHPSQNPAEPRRLRRVYQLNTATENEIPCIRRLHGSEAIEVLMQNIYRLGLAEYMGYKPAAFRVCAAMARHVPVFRFCRPKGFDKLVEGIEVLEGHLRAI